MKVAMEWARSHGILKDSDVPAEGMSDAEVNRLIEERNAAKKARDFAKSDAIRKQLAEAGVILEDTKDGVRWKRK
jgi:cysteinyl-tRNA synthetase